MATSAVVCKETPSFSIVRKGRYLIVELKHAARCLTTSHLGGGARDDLRYLINHQSCEGAGHADRAHEIIELGQIEYHKKVCDELDLPSQETAIMGTAANMQYAAIKTESFEDLEVTAIVTAGVQGNAGRAGDPARWHEKEGQYVNVAAEAGTINTILVINLPMIDAALLRSVVTATEAKSAALQELAVSSRASNGLATGTGTDQVCLASICDDSRHPLTWAGKHTKVGELIALAVKGATKEALKWQNGLEPSRVRCIFHALGRFGLKEEILESEFKTRLKESDFELYKKNKNSLVFEPQVSACAYALAGILDRIEYETFPNDTVDEMILGQCSLMAVALSAHAGTFDEMREALSQEDNDCVKRVCAALALGWQKKWKTS